MSPCPVVLVIAGHDPTGGAGIQADIETLGALGCHAATVITALTVQDTRGVTGFEASAPDLVCRQARAVLEDMPVAAIKLGMLATPGIIEVVARLLDEHPRLPVVLDPVLAGGGGGSLSRQGMAGHLREQLLCRVTLATPNGPELLALAPEAESPAQAAALLSRTSPRLHARDAAARGTTAILATGGHEPSTDVINTLWCAGEIIGQQAWQRLPHEFHGSGCTLASACAAFLARGYGLTESIRQAQHFTWHALHASRPLGRGQLIPRRVPHPLIHPPVDPEGHGS